MHRCAPHDILAQSNIETILRKPYLFEIVFARYTAARRCPDSVITLSMMDEMTAVTEFKILIDFTEHQSPHI